LATGAGKSILTTEISNNLSLPWEEVFFGELNVKRWVHIWYVKMIGEGLVGGVVDEVVEEPVDTGVAIENVMPREIN